MLVCQFVVCMCCELLVCVCEHKYVYVVVVVVAVNVVVSGVMREYAHSVLVWCVLAVHFMWFHYIFSCELFVCRLSVFFPASRCLSCVMCCVCKGARVGYHVFVCGNHHQSLFILVVEEPSRKRYVFWPHHAPRP